MHQLAQEKLNKTNEGGQAFLPAALTVHSIGMQSVTIPEFFHRCSPDWPQTEDAQMLHHRDIPSRAWRSMNLNMNEQYEFLGALNASAGGAAAGSKDTGPCAHASTLNTQLGIGKMQRSTRSSGSAVAQTAQYCGSRIQAARCLPDDFRLPAGVNSRWTWLPLLARLAQSFG